VRASSNHTRTIGSAMVLLAAVIALMSGCASHRSVRCNGKLEPINASAIVPALNLGAARSRPIGRSETQ
jgi:type IV pilus biogenesis protein CpaD/CtpE